MEDDRKSEHLGKVGDPTNQNSVNVLISNVDLYQTFAIAKGLSKERMSNGNYAYSIYGTIKESSTADMTAVMDCVNGIIDFDVSAKDAEYMVLRSSIFVLDIGVLSEDELSETRKILLMIQNWAKAKQAADPIDPSLDKEKQKFIILISTPCVWALTPPPIHVPKNPDEDEGDKTPEEVEEQEPDNSFKESDYRKRRAHPNYIKHKCFEREVILMQSKFKTILKTVVICPGITYGGANDIFQCFFKLPFYDKETIPILSPGTQTVPMIYIEDFAGMVKDIVLHFPPKKIRYIFAAQPKPIVLKQFGLIAAQAIAGDFHKVKVISKEDIFQADDELFTQRVFDALTLNFKFKVSYFEKYTFLLNEDLTQKVCEKLAIEFRATRNLYPLKIIVDGPPYSGKTCLSQKLAAFYQLNYVNPETIICDTIDYLKYKILEARMYLDMAPESSEFAEDEIEEGRVYSGERELVHNKLEDWTLEFNEAMEYEKLSRAEAFKPNFVYIKTLLTRVLSSLTCNKNQGYVMDGCPFTYDEANALFFSNDNLQTMNEGFEEMEEGDGFGEINKMCSLCPTHLIVIDACDELLCARAKSVCEEYAELTGGTEEKMLERLQNYRERNEEDTSLTSLFYDNDIIPITVCVEVITTHDEIFEICKREIGTPFLYPPTKLEKERIDMELAALKQRQDSDAEEKRVELMQKMRFEREKKLQEWTKNYERLKEEEDRLYEAKTVPFREYLTKFVLPTLTEGILKVAENKPKDPIDFLAEYLFECNPNGHVLSEKYSETKMTELLKRGNTDITKSVDGLAENVQKLECTFDLNKKKRLEYKVGQVAISEDKKNHRKTAHKK